MLLPGRPLCACPKEHECEDVSVGPVSRLLYQKPVKGIPGEYDVTAVTGSNYEHTDTSSLRAALIRCSKLSLVHRLSGRSLRLGEGAKPCLGRSRRVSGRNTHNVTTVSLTRFVTNGCCVCESAVAKSSYVVSLICSSEVVRSMSNPESSQGSTAAAVMDLPASGDHKHPGYAHNSFRRVLTSELASGYSRRSRWPRPPSAGL